MTMQIMITAIIGYLVVILKDIPKSMFKLFKTNYSSSMTTTTDSMESYIILNNYLLSLNKKSINNNIENQEYCRKGKTNKIESINYGTFFIRIDFLTWMVISKELKDNGYNLSSTLNTTIFGLRRFKIIENIRMLMNIENTDSIQVFCSMSEYDCGILAPKKSFDNVYIEGKDILKSKIDKWNINEELFKSKGIIHKVGILLYGKPGTGKSSTARAIASYLDYNVYVINLKGFKSTMELMNKLLSITEKSVVLFEDIDCIISNREDSSEDSNILGVALNFIDGIYSPNNCVIIATTNYIDRLDNAFIRDGRFDIKMEINDMTLQLAEQMCNDYGVDIDSLDIDKEHINPSELQNKLINYINN